MVYFSILLPPQHGYLKINDYVTYGLALYSISICRFQGMNRLDKKGFKILLLILLVVLICFLIPTFILEELFEYRGLIVIFIIQTVLIIFVSFIERIFKVELIQNPQSSQINKPSRYYYNTSISLSQIKDHELSINGHIISGSLPNQIKVGEFIGDCIVCYLPMYERDELVKCPHCLSLAHRIDFLEWMKIKGTCPSCGALLKYIAYKIVEAEILLSITR